MKKVVAGILKGMEDHYHEIYKGSLKEDTLLFWQIAAPFLMGDSRPTPLIALEMVPFLENDMKLLINDDFLSDDRLGSLTGFLDF